MGETFKDALAVFLADWNGPEDTDDIVTALRECADELENPNANDA